MTLLPALAFLVLGVAACTTLNPAACRAGEQRMDDDLLYFGTATADGAVTAGDWTAFLNGSVTPRFPGGFTVWQAAGRWRTRQGSIVEEASYVLDLVHRSDAAGEAAVAGIIAEYKVRYRQDAVLRVRSPACVAF